VRLAGCLDGRLVGLALGLVLLAVPPAYAHHHYPALYEGTNAQGGEVEFKVASIDGSPVGVYDFYLGAVKGKTDLGQDCVPTYPPPAARPDYLTPVVDHAFSSTTPPVMISGSFSEPLGAGGTFRIRSGVSTPPEGGLPSGSICDTGDVSWTASCSPVSPSCSAAPTFSRSASEAKVSTGGRVTVPWTIGCPSPGAGCRVSVVGRARVHASAAAKRRRVTLGRSAYLVKVGSSAAARFKLTATGRRTLRRLDRVKAKVEIKVTRGTSVTRKTVTARLKAPKRTA
jgi:hypothetical protein